MIFFLTRIRIRQEQGRAYRISYTSYIPGSMYRLVQRLNPVNLVRGVFGRWGPVFFPPHTCSMSPSRPADGRYVCACFFPVRRLFSFKNKMFLSFKKPQLPDQKRKKRKHDSSRRRQGLTCVCENSGSISLETGVNVWALGRKTRAYFVQLPCYYLVSSLYFGVNNGIRLALRA